MRQDNSIYILTVDINIIGYLTLVSNPPTFAALKYFKDNNKYIGSVLITHDGRKGWINQVVVLPDYRKQGIALKLVDAGEQ